MTEEDYIAAHIDAEPAALRRLYRHTHMHRLYSRMCTDHIQGRILAMLTHMINPRRVLELGTFSGYSTLCFAEALADGGHIDTVELDTEYADDLRELFETEAPGKITLHTGDAEALLPALLRDNDYDMRSIMPLWPTPCVKVLISSPTILCGQTRCSTPMLPTLRPTAYVSSTTPWPPTRAWRR